MKNVSLIALLLLLGASCGSISGRGGVYISQDYGETWQASAALSEDEAAQSLANAQILTLSNHPALPDTIFAGTANLGLLRSDDAGISWQSVTTAGQIQAFAASPSNQDRYLAARNNQIYYSADAGVTWKLAFTSQIDQTISGLAFDSLHANRFYASSSSGELLVSSDEGKSWTSLFTFKQAIQSVLTHPRNSGRLYVISLQNGVFKSNDSGSTWTEISESLEVGIDQYTNPVHYKQLLVHPDSAENLLLLTRQGIFWSNDAGDNWQKLHLLNEADNGFITTIAWDPLNRQRIYYSTANVLYRSENFGGSWQTIPLNFASPPGSIVISPQTPSRLYLGIHRQ